jgi:hypothetical protein
MRRRAALVAFACVLLAACGTPHAIETLDHEPDLANVSATFVPHGVRATIAQEISRLRRACTEIEPTVATELPGTHFRFDDVQCQWTESPGAPPLVVVGILDGGTYRFDEARALLDDRIIGGLGNEALYDPAMRILYTVRADRLWYVQLVASPARGADARRSTIAIGRALMHATATS